MVHVGFRSIWNNTISNSQPNITPFGRNNSICFDTNRQLVVGMLINQFGLFGVAQLSSDVS